MPKLEIAAMPQLSDPGPLHCECSASPEGFDCRDIMANKPVAFLPWIGAGTMFGKFCCSVEVAVKLKTLGIDNTRTGVKEADVLANLFRMRD